MREGHCDLDMKILRYKDTYILIKLKRNIVHVVFEKKILKPSLYFYGELWTNTGAPVLVDVSKFVKLTICTL